MLKLTFALLIRTFRMLIRTFTMLIHTFILSLGALPLRFRHFALWLHLLMLRTRAFVCRRRFSGWSKAL